MACSRVATRPAWRWTRLLAGLGLGLGVWVGGGCGIDNRVLTSEDLPSGGAGRRGASDCDAEPADACEACIYASCCEQAEACGAGSACLTYLRCAEACAGDAACENRCATASPSGFGDALALGLCSQTECAACTGEAAAFDSCDPNGGGACQSVNDCSALNAGALEELDTVACSACDADLLARGCSECLSTQTGLSQACSSCVAEWMACAVVNCLLPCDVGTDPEECQACLMSMGCTAQLGVCAFAR